jgi:CRP-like cAMP-binding protein
MGIDAGMQGVDRSRLASVEVFSDLSDEEVERVAAQMRLVTLRVGGVPVEEGDLSSRFFVILNGAVTVHRAGHHVADLGPGDAFGEGGVLGKQSRNATVIATMPTELAVLMGWDLRELVERLPALKARLDSLVARRSSDA